MGRLVIVSNRVADPRKAAAGGLAVALGPALQEAGGVWMGWSGRVVDNATPPAELGRVHTRPVGSATLATLDLSDREYKEFYLGFSNSVLWPVFHYRLDLADYRSEYLDGYLSVNRRFAQALKPLLRDDDLVWVHDYHLIPLAEELRLLGCHHRIGFFLHIPLPPPMILAAMPSHEVLLRALFAYDVIGVQSEADVGHFAGYVQREAGARPLGDGRFEAYGHTVLARAFPIGIDVGEFRSLCGREEAISTWQQAVRDYSSRRLLVGVDRLDYSKGLPQRLAAFQDLLRRHSDQRKSATLIQIAAPSRESVDAYADLRQQLNLLCGTINAEHGSLDQMPVRYLNRTLSRKRLPGLYRASRVGLVTPLRDGMNLVAKEYVVAQDPEDPGVLVLSRFAGAAEQMTAALLVNPFDIHRTADAMERALRMPREERVERHRALLETVERCDVKWWLRNFLAALRGEEARPSELEADRELVRTAEQRSRQEHAV
jgi:trehalose 6-phosphate synthase